MEFGAPELIIILIIVLLIFGVGRISKLGSELGQGLKSFRQGLQSEDDPSEQVSSSGEEHESKPSADDHKTITYT
jgi:sec-independent protein translocase protein TatA